MALLVEAVFMNAGSSVTNPVLARSFAMSIACSFSRTDHHRHLQDLVLDFQLGGQSVLRRVLGHGSPPRARRSITYILDGEPRKPSQGSSSNQLTRVAVVTVAGACG